MKNFLMYLKENPRIVVLVSGVVVQILEQFNIKVEQELVENTIDVVTVVALGVVMKKSVEGKVI